VTTTALSPLPAVRIDDVELVRVAMPLVRPFRTSFGTQTDRDVLLVRVTDRDGREGWGECVAPAAPVYDADFTDGAALVLRDHLIPALLAGGAAVDAVTVRSRWARFHGHPTATAALEAAVWDLQLRAADRSLADHLGVTRTAVPTGVSVGIPVGTLATATGALIEQIAEHLAEGYLRVKAKVEPGFDVAPLSAVRDAFPDLALQVDANTAYDPDEPDHVAALDGLDELGLVMLEQPFAADRLRDHAHHAARWTTPVCLDESILDRWRARDAVLDGAASIVNVKVGRIGGLVESIAVHDVGRALDVPVWCGGMLETGVGRAVNVALGGLPGFTLPGDTSASARYWAEDLTDPFVLEAGHLAIPRAPGTGRTPDPDRLAAWTTARERLGAARA
jgi:o-succinylbenzoate synthase